MVRSAARHGFRLALTAALLFGAIVFPADVALALKELTVGVNGPGRVTSAPAGINCPGDCEEDFPDNTAVILTPTPDPGNSFTGWSGDLGGTNSPDTITLDTDKSVIANFAATTNTLTVTNTGSGTGLVRSDPAGLKCKSRCSADFNQGSVVTLTAQPDNDSIFAGWSGGGCTGSGDCNLILAQDTPVKAIFDQRTRYSLEVTRAGTGGGRVSSASGSIDCGPICENSYNEGDVVTLTALPDNDSIFTGWSGDCSGTGPACPVTMSANRRVWAGFSPKTATLTVELTGDGWGAVIADSVRINAPGADTVTVTVNSPVTLYARPDDGSRFAGWSHGDCPGDGECTVTVSDDTTVAAGFSRAADQADLKITKRADNARPGVGELATFTIEVTNLGPAPAEGVVITEKPVYPDRLEYTYTPSYSYDPASGKWTIGTLSPGQTVTETIVYTVTSALPAINRAEVDLSGPTEPDWSNNTARATLNDPDPQADLGIGGRNTQNPARVGQAAPFAVNINNPGPDTATYTRLSVSRSPAVPNLNYMPPADWIFRQVPQDGVIDLGDLLPGTSTGVRFQGQVTEVPSNARAEWTLTVEADTNDPDANDNSFDVNLPIDTASYSADVAVAKWSDREAVSHGDTVEFTIEVTNKGPDTAHGVVIGDDASSDLTFTSSTAGNFKDRSGQWSIGSLGVGETATCLVTATVSGTGLPRNSAWIKSAATPDPDTHNNSASIFMMARFATSDTGPDCRISTTADRDTSNLSDGDRVTTTTTVGSGSGRDLSGNENLQVKVDPPQGTAMRNLLPSRGCFDRQRQLWFVDLPDDACLGGSIAVAEAEPSASGPPTLTMTLEVTDAAALSQSTLVTTVSSGLGADPDPTDNTSCLVFNRTDAYVTDLALGVTANSETARPGDEAAYTVAVTNTGPDADPAVMVDTAWTNDLSYVVFQATQGTFDRPTGRWLVGGLGVGRSARLELIVRPTVAAGPARVSALLAGLTGTDVNPDNDADSAALLVLSGD